MTSPNWIEAIAARKRGEWDNPELVKFGPLSTDTQADIRDMCLRAASAAQINGVKEDAQSVVFEINSFLLDHCPDGQNWEDFDPDIDGARQVLIDMFDL